MALPRPNPDEYTDSAIQAYEPSEQRKRKGEKGYYTFTRTYADGRVLEWRTQEPEGWVISAQTVDSAIQRAFKQKMDDWEQEQKTLQSQPVRVEDPDGSIVWRDKTTGVQLWIERPYDPAYDPRLAPAKGAPTVREFPDGSLRQWDPQGQKWDQIGAAPQPSEPKPVAPTVREFPDGSLRQWDPTTRQWSVIGQPKGPIGPTGPTPGQLMQQATADADRALQDKIAGWQNDISKGRLSLDQAMAAFDQEVKNRQLLLQRQQLAISGFADANTLMLQGSKFAAPPGMVNFPGYGPGEAAATTAKLLGTKFTPVPITRIGFDPRGDVQRTLQGGYDLPALKPTVTGTYAGLPTPSGYGAPLPPAPTAPPAGVGPPTPTAPAPAPTPASGLPTPPTGPPIPEPALAPAPMPAPPPVAAPVGGGGQATVMGLPTPRNPQLPPRYQPTIF